MHPAGTCARYCLRPLWMIGPLLAVVALSGCQQPARGERSAPSAPTGSAAAPDVAPQPQAAPSDPAPAATPPPRQYVAYYFHRTLRCATCLSIEKQSRETIELAYGGELAEGRLRWQTVNIEQPGREHFERDFELERGALVLVEEQGGAIARFKKLEQVWELVEDAARFREYVVREVAAFLAGG